jgi:hypothetical protein
MSRKCTERWEDGYILLHHQTVEGKNRDYDLYCTSAVNTGVVHSSLRHDWRSVVLHSCTVHGRRMSVLTKKKTHYRFKKHAVPNMKAAWFFTSPTFSSHWFRNLQSKDIQLQRLWFYIMLLFFVSFSFTFLPFFSFLQMLPSKQSLVLCITCQCVFG